jgi:hypothetical protein
LGRTDWKWEKYPVIHFEFNDVTTTSMVDFETSFAIHVQERLEKAGFTYDESLPPPENFGNAIESLSAANGGKGVVILIDEYDAVDEPSMADNNSSAFNFRTISDTNIISKHGLGIAVDINPLYNPYIFSVPSGAETGADPGSGDELIIEPANGAPYADREKEFAYKIEEGDLCLRLFKEHGFEWDGDWTHAKDYQHFELPDETANGLRRRYGLPTHG